LEFLYFQRQTLQGDVSIENILISSVNSAEDTKGCLIDFDHAQMVKKTKLAIVHQT
ncbi:hypothetical protein C0995_004992, partial [Termitomyces sp. Mi166